MMFLADLYGNVDQLTSNDGHNPILVQSLIISQPIISKPGLHDAHDSNLAHATRGEEG